ncbi:MAG: peptidoglycan DD-metalloendopeptidase family protein [Alistipes sp.]|uniref:M23 family metallopeptidase n=1 Tax=Alistipes TaxID=239759 RepID=UPI00101C6FB8|nr:MULTISPECIES: M23 family metallopeptidase [Alistipes]MBQ7892742.1 peptidoglycan DD-metalloendopeptidase family protein [Alistipes sp.]MBR2219040.1 peptidoglycan DD-metalloendopeptidase family protein [Alistipes sp.]
MKKYLLTLAALSLVLTSAARKPKNARTQTAAKNSEAAIADSLLAVTTRQASLIDSLRSLVVAEHTAGELSGDRNEAEETEEPVVSPEQAAADSVAALQLRLRPTKIESIFDTNGLTVIDTLATDNDAVQVILYSNNSWKYVRNREIAKDSTIFEKYWDTTTLFPYREVDMSGMPKSVVIDLVDSLTCYHCPYQGTVHPHGKYGPRRRRQHQGVDLPLKTGDPVYATFCGRVRISQYNKGGYGNLVIIRHDNGLETYYGHLSERMVEPGQWVEAGQIIGLGGSTGRSTGPHLHFETRYYGQSFDPERLIDFKNGTLSRETFLLKKSFFSIYSNAGQDFEDEIANEEQDKKEAAEKAAMKYYKIRSGDTLGAIARRHGTTVANLCRLNGIKSTTILRIGRSLRVR